MHSFHVQSKSPLLGCGLVLITMMAGAVLAVLAGVAALFMAVPLLLGRLTRALRGGAPAAAASARPSPAREKAPAATVIDVEAVQVDSKQER